MKRSDTNLTDGTHALDQQRLMYYNAAWQLIEERIDENYQSAAGINRHVQYVWGVGGRYIDDIIAHRQDDDPAQADGYETVWFHLTDAQFSTVAIIDSNANVTERITYSAYGRARHHWMADIDGDGSVTTAKDINVIRGIALGSNNRHLS